MFFTSSAHVARVPLPAMLKRFVRNQSGSVTSEFVVVSALIISLAAGVLEMTSNGTQVLAEKVGEEVLTERDPSGGRDRHRPAQGGYSPIDDGAHKSASGARETASTGTTSSGNSSTASGGSKDNTSKKTDDDKASTPDKAAEAPSDTAKEPATKPAQKDKKPEKTAESKKAQKKKSGSNDSAEAGEPGEQVVAENEYDPSCYKKNGKLRKRCR